MTPLHLSLMLSILSAMLLTLVKEEKERA